MASIRRKKRKWQPVKISFGFIIFAIMFVYMLIRIIMSLGDHDLSVFQVEESNYDTNFTATGLAVRKETLNYSSTSAIISGMAKKLQRVPVYILLMKPVPCRMHCLMFKIAEAVCYPIMIIKI